MNGESFDVESASPAQLVRALMGAQWSQQRIADEVGVTQPSISRILSGRHHDPRHSLVERLRELVRDVERERAREHIEDGAADLI